jgi:Zn-dependent M16 (insulinase) family peptidase
MSVYGNAVFHPLLPEWTFMQEGHRYEFSPDGAGGGGKLSITGIVYNEMKGAYSSSDAYAGLWSVKAIMPGTPYAFESGGDPEAIPSLTWEGLKEFHKTRYSPANCKVFLAGNIPTEKQLAFLNEKFFSKLEGGKECAPIKKTEQWKMPQKFKVPCPAGGENKATVFLSWLCCDVTDINENIALAALTEILLGHDGSPLTRTLIESGLGEDLTPVSGLEGEIRETLFVAGLKGVDGNIEKKAQEIEELIMGEMQRLVSEGIPPQEIEAALLAMEFSQREIRRSGGPFSLVWMRRSLRSWLHGTKPWESLLLEPALAAVKDKLASDKRYFESLIKKYFLDNPHRALVILEPKKDFLQNQEENLARSLADIERNMSGDERQKIKDKCALLAKIQSEADTPEALASIPHLSRSDLSVDHDIIHRRHEDLKGVPALCHELYTNGITYADMAFPVDTLPEEDLPWLPFFAHSIISVGLPGMDYGEVSSLVARTMGGLNSVLHTGSAAPNTPSQLKTASGVFDLAGRNWIIFRLKCLDEKIAASLDLVLRLICEAEFGDYDHLNDLVLEMKNEIDSSLAPMGHMYASGRAGRNNSPSKKMEETWLGLSQIDFIHRLARMDIASVAAKLKSLQEKIAASGVIANLTGLALENAMSGLGQRFSRFGAPKPRLSVKDTSPAGAPVEVYSSPSLQVGFASQTHNAAVFDTKGQIAEMVLAHRLSTGALWEDIRMKGGAYGAFVSSDSLENCVSFATYRDPNPLRSLETISGIIKGGLSSGAINSDGEDLLVKTIIGCYAKETRPRTGAENGLIDFYRFLYGVEDSYRKRKLERLVSVTTKDIDSAFSELGARPVTGSVIITGQKNAEQIARALRTDIKALPV